MLSDSADGDAVPVGVLAPETIPYLLNLGAKAGQCLVYYLNLGTTLVTHTDDATAVSNVKTGTIELASAHVLADHCTFTCKPKGPEGLLITCLSNDNKDARTSINRVKLQGTIELNSGDEVVIGTNLFRYENPARPNRVSAGLLQSPQSSRMDTSAVINSARSAIRTATGRQPLNAGGDDDEVSSSGAIPAGGGLEEDIAMVEHRIEQAERVADAERAKEAAIRARVAAARDEVEQMEQMTQQYITAATDAEDAALRAAIAAESDVFSAGDSLTVLPNHASDTTAGSNHGRDDLVQAITAEKEIGEVKLKLAAAERVRAKQRASSEMDIEQVHKRIEAAEQEKEATIQARAEQYANTEMEIEQALLLAAAEWEKEAAVRARVTAEQEEMILMERMTQQYISATIDAEDAVSHTAVAAELGADEGTESTHLDDHEVAPHISRQRVSGITIQDFVATCARLTASSTGQSPKEGSAAVLNSIDQEAAARMRMHARKDTSSPRRLKDTQSDTGSVGSPKKRVSFADLLEDDTGTASDTPEGPPSNSQSMSQASTTPTLGRRFGKTRATRVLPVPPCHAVAAKPSNANEGGSAAGSQSPNLRSRPEPYNLRQQTADASHSSTSPHTPTPHSGIITPQPHRNTPHTAAPSHSHCSAYTPPSTVFQAELFDVNAASMNRDSDSKSHSVASNMDELAEARRLSTFSSTNDAVRTEAMPHRFGTADTISTASFPLAADDQGTDLTPGTTGDVLLEIDGLATNLASVLTDATAVVAGAAVVGASVASLTVAGVSVAGAAVVGASVTGATVIGASVAGTAVVAGASVAGLIVVGASVTGDSKESPMHGDHDDLVFTSNQKPTTHNAPAAPTVDAAVHKERRKSASYKELKQQIVAWLDLDTKHVPLYLIHLIINMTSTRYGFPLVPAYGLYNMIVSQAIRDTPMLVSFHDLIGETFRKALQAACTQRSINKLAMILSNATELLMGLRTDEELLAESGSLQVELNDCIQDAHAALLDLVKVRLNPAYATILREGSVSAGLGSTGTMRGGRQSHVGPGLLFLLESLDVLHTLFFHVLLPTSLVQLVFDSIYYHAGSVTFNLLMNEKDPNFITWDRGLLIQFNVSQLNEWAREHGLPITHHLAPIMQSARLLQLNKSSIAHLDSLCAACPQLNSLQIECLLKKYKPTEGEPVVAKALLDCMRARAMNNVDRFAEDEETARCRLQIMRDENHVLPFRLMGPYHVDQGMYDLSNFKKAKASIEQCSIKNTGNEVHQEGQQTSQAASAKSGSSFSRWFRSKTQKQKQVDFDGDGLLSAEQWAGLGDSDA